MSIGVAEYLGIRTNQDGIPIVPCSLDDPPDCPFAIGQKCSKVNTSAKNEPVCAVRNNDGVVWITCPERLCSTKQGIPFCDSQKDVLLQIARAVYSPEVEPAKVCVKREVRLIANDSTKYHADYVMTLSDGRTNYPGPDRLIIEMQGGGETGQTGKLTRHIKEWRSSVERTNSQLREKIAANTLETNAWRRQQEQFIVKGNVAMKTWKGYGICFCVGTILYDYLMKKLDGITLPDLKDYNWTLAILAFKEDPDNVGESLHFVIDPERTLYTNYQTFVHALINQGEPTLDAFRGEFQNLENDIVTVWP